jgi:hypothetical protein
MDFLKNWFMIAYAEPVRFVAGALQHFERG